MSDEQPWTFGQSPYMNTEEARVYLRQSSREAFVKWARRHNVTLLQRGRQLLVDRRELDAALRGPKRRRRNLELLRSGTGGPR